MFDTKVKYFLSKKEVAKILEQYRSYLRMTETIFYLLDIEKKTATRKIIDCYFHLRTS